MALFSKTKKEAAPKKTAKKTAVKKATKEVAVVHATPVAAAVSMPAKAHLANILRQIRITEKASMLVEKGVYVFNISEGATKADVSAAIRAFHGVTPRKVRVVTIHPKIRRSFRTGRVGVKSGGRKAYVYLKEGEVISNL